GRGHGALPVQWTPLGRRRSVDANDARSWAAGTERGRPPTWLRPSADQVPAGFWGWFWGYLPEAGRFSRRVSRYRGKVSVTAGDFLPDEMRGSSMLVLTEAAAEVVKAISST